MSGVWETINRGSSTPWTAEVNTVSSIRQSTYQVHCSPVEIATFYDPAKKTDVHALVRYFGGLTGEAGHGLRVGVAYWYGFWPVRFAEAERGLLAQAMGLATDVFEDDVTNAVACWKQQ